MRKLLMFVLLVFLYCPAFAQEALWSRTYGGSSDEDFGWSVQQTTDGGYIVTGYTYSFGAGEGDVYLIKTDSLGDTLWTRTCGGSDREWGRSVQQTTDGGYIVVGSTRSFGAGEGDVYLIKTDSNGDTLWTRTYGGSDGGDGGGSVQQTTDEGYIVAGVTSSFGAGESDVYLIKTDSLGDTLWTRTYGGSGEDCGRFVLQTKDGGYMVAGYTYSFGAGNRDVYLIKTDPTGDTLWTRTYGGSGWDEGTSVQQTTDGGYVVAGRTDSFGVGYWAVYLIKTDSNGDTLWTRTYGGSSGDVSNSVQQTTDGGYIVAGETNSFGAGEDDVYLIKTDSLGDTLWTRTYGGSSWEQGSSVQQTTDGGYVVAGWTHSFGAGGGDFMLTKLDSLGNTCMGEFVSSTVMSEPCSVTSPATVVTSPPTVVTSPATEVTSPPTEVTTVCVAIRGDANGSGSVDLADAVFVVNWLFIGGPAPDPLWLGDANCSGSVDLADAVYIVNWLFIGGPPPGC
jgi:hypothetical protein